MTVWINGDWRDDAAVSYRDRGFTLGDGLFETIAVERGVALGLERHIERLRSSADALGLADPLAGIDLAGLIGQGAQASGLASAVARFSVSAGLSARGLERADQPELTRVLQFSGRPQSAKSINLALADIRRSPTSPSARFKTLSYADNIFARRQACAAGADMAVLLDEDGRVSGGDCANLYWAVDGQLHTPALACAVLPGTVRASLLAQLDLNEVSASLSDLASADSIFVSNAVMGVVPVSGLDGKKLTVDHALLETLREALAQDRDTTIERRGRR
ncbi:aminotransferase class IV [Maricaulis sp. MIT060901]|uniref:aminotransferase class IV n=1 Tax=Maricaulis sp. MIT060901 TaxID=3096993 RepID=UPI00399B5E55